MSKCGVFSGPYFPAFGLYTDQKKLCVWTHFTLVIVKDSFAFGQKTLEQDWNFFYKIHCVKSVQIRSYFLSVFFCIWIEYGDLRSKLDVDWLDVDSLLTEISLVEIINISFDTLFKNIERGNVKMLVFSRLFPILLKTDIAKLEVNMTNYCQNITK